MPHHQDTGIGAMARRLRRAAGLVAVEHRSPRTRPDDPAEGGEQPGPRSTLEATIRRQRSSRYTQLVWGPGEPHQARGDLGVGPGSDRAATRRSLVHFAHHTDTHVCDAQATARLEPGERFAWFNPGADGGHRPQETCTTQVLDQMVQATNAARTSPVTGAPLAFVVETGDNTDNRTVAETAWFVDVLDGNPVRPDTGALGSYEGVQRQSRPSWTYHPDDPTHDRYGRFGFPRLPGFLDAAVRPFEPVGSAVPWLAVMGNHDSVLLGTFGPLPGDVGFDPMGRMLEGSGRKPANVLGMLRAMVHASVLGTDTRRWDRGRVDLGLQRVTPDPVRRRALPLREWLEALLAGNPEPGPVGHGFSSQNVEDGTAWWSRPHGDHVQLVGLDTCNHTTGSEGALGDQQLRWLEAELQRHSTRWLDERGRTCTGPGPDRLCVLFSHHSSWTLTNVAEDRLFPGPRHLGPEVVELLLRYPNVVLWVNGHTHEHTVVPHRGAAPGTGFWEVNTASCIDFGQQARTIELVDNGDDTLSIFCTVLDHAAPPSVRVTSHGDYSPRELASLSRELSANDARWFDPFDLLGHEEDRNVELLVRAPFPLGGP